MSPSHATKPDVDGLPGGERDERGVDGRLPALVRDVPRRLLGGHDADVMLGERDIHERAALRTVEPAQDELSERCSMRGGAGGAFRDEPAARPRRRAERSGDDRDDELQEI